jgi:hypothetical protein
VAQAAGRGLSRVGLLPDQAPPRSNRWRHWAYSLTRVHDSGGIADLDVPWWTYGAIDAVQAFIDSRRGDVRAFEWGSGASTIWLARRVTTVDSVEHHRGFGEMMIARVGEFPNATVSIVEPVPSDAPVVPSLKEGQRGMDFADYVAQMELVAGGAGRFDLVVIDGRAREACLAAALPRLAPGGVVVFDNSWRIRYRRAIKSLPVNETIHRGLTPTTPYPEQTSVITRA